MQFVSTAHLDAIIERFDDSEAIYEQMVQQFEDTQPALAAYLFSEDFDAFTPEEHEFLLMLAIIIFTAVSELRDTLPTISDEQIANAEEANWARLEALPEKRLNDRLNVFFDQYLQEDLLAFIEEALADDDDDPIVTKEAREGMFVVLKTLTDCLIAD